MYCFVPFCTFNTLDVSGTGFQPEQTAIIYGKGSSLSQANYTRNRGKSKLIGMTLSRLLADIANENGREDLADSFWSCYYCQSSLTIHEGKSYGYYCRQRFCPMCSKIRKAELINKYRPIIQKWEDPYFVTITVLACTALELNAKIKKVKEVYELLTRRFKQQNKRGKGIKVMCVRSIECNYNPLAGTYNPHIHLIVPNRKVANLIMSTWLKTWGVWEATGEHQHKRKIRDLDHDLIETIKYGTKFFTEPNPRDKKTKVPRTIYIRAMYNILVAMRNMKQFHYFGFKHPKIEKQEKQAPSVVIDFSNFDYHLGSADWIDTETGNPLTAYQPDSDLLDMLQERLDREAQ